MDQLSRSALDMDDVFVRVVLGAFRVRQIEGGDTPHVEAGRRSAPLVALEEFAVGALDLEALRCAVEESFSAGKEKTAAASSTSSVRRAIESLDLNDSGAFPTDED